MELCEESVLNLNNAITIEYVQKFRNGHKIEFHFKMENLGVSSDEVEQILDAYVTKFEWNEIQNFESFSEKVEEAEKSN